jgi:cation diffusion facilitator CzcD-associated flavoprotein CzcO
MTAKDGLGSSSNALIDFDVVIIGAGISGINAAHRVQTQAPQGTSYVIFEGRSSIGGTWDLFHYPGIRSDSDIYTFGFPWSPWPKNETLATGAAIKEYLIRSAKTAGIDRQILYQHKVTSARWLSDERCWALTIAAEEKTSVLRARFVLLGTGYITITRSLFKP